MVRLLSVALVLLLNTACLEHLGALVTRVTYDPHAQEFEVERVLRDVRAPFLGCSDVASCLTAIERVMEQRPPDVVSPPLSDRLLQRSLQAEWRAGLFGGRDYLVLQAQEAMAPPPRYRSR